VPDIHITREHELGLADARKLAFKWAETAEEKLDMECTYEEGKTSDLVTFTRSGVNGELKVTKDKFVLDARLGFLLGAFKERIEGEIVKNLDKLLAQKDPHHAFDKALAKHSESKKAAPPKKAAPAKAASKKKA
jgi:putative polyhydroxyalkanoate system protein